MKRIAEWVDRHRTRSGTVQYRYGTWIATATECGVTGESHPQPTPEAAWADAVANLTLQQDADGAVFQALWRESHATEESR